MSSFPNVLDLVLAKEPGELKGGGIGDSLEAGEDIDAEVGGRDDLAAVVSFDEGSVYAGSLEEADGDGEWGWRWGAGGVSCCIYHSSSSRS